MGWGEKLAARVLHGTNVALEGMPGTETSEFVLRMQSGAAVLRMALAPEYWVPEGYVRGYWSLAKGDLGDFARHMMDRSGQGMMRKFTSQSARRVSLQHLWQHWITPIRATRAVKAHYDIDNRIYELILDPEMVYTAAFFEEADTLDAAQQAKLTRILDRLNLPHGARVIDIGCGWGSLARHFVRARPDIHITGITISSGQLAWALEHNARTLTPQQQARVDLRLEDFRHHKPSAPYDAVVSVGLFEHVGRSLYGDFFKACARFCAPNGTILTHTIVKNRSGISTNRWIDRNIFPGGYIASVAEIARASEEAALDLSAVHLHGPMNYGNTCRAWRENLIANRDQIMSVYIDDHGLTQAEAERGFRTWEIYLAGAEAGFMTKHRPMQTAQVVFRPTGMRGATVIQSTPTLQAAAE